MRRGVGFLGFLFFVTISFINYVLLKESTDILIYSSFLTGILYLLTTVTFPLISILQIMITLGYGCFALYQNDSNSLVPLIMLYLAVNMTNKYYPKEKYITLLYPLPFLATALFTGWSFREIILTIVLYTAYTTTQCIFNHT